MAKLKRVFDQKDERYLDTPEVREITDYATRTAKRFLAKYEKAGWSLRDVVCVLELELRYQSTLLRLAREGANVDFAGRTVRQSHSPKKGRK